MAKILVVDDRETNRLLLSSILVPSGHTVLESSDGIEALIAAERSRPDLVITDVLMPTMDGFELVRSLRTKPGLASIPVIFYTAHYLEREARALAAECGVPEILCKPVEPADVLLTVDRALHAAASAPPGRMADDRFDREHLRLVTNKLADQTENLRHANLRLKALTEIGLELNLNRDLDEFSAIFCRAARYVVGASYASLVLLPEPGGVERLMHSGLDPAAEIALRSLGSVHETFRVLLRGRHVCRGFNLCGDPTRLGLPREYPAVYSFLLARVVSPSHDHALLFFANRVSTIQFDADDEMLAAMLASQLAVACDNYVLWEEAQQRSAELERHLARDREMQQALRRSEERLRAILDNTSATVYLLSPDGSVLLANRAAARAFGAPLEHVLQKNLRELLPGPVGDALWAGHLKVLTSREPMESEDRIPQSDGVHTYLASRFPLLDPDGKVYAVGSVASDSTAQKEMEEQLRQAQRMESIGRLAGGIAHDFNNLLTVINGYCSMLLKDHTGRPGEEKLQQILQAGESAAAMTRQLLAFSRRQHLSPRPLHLEEVVSRMRLILRRMLEDDIRLVTELSPNTGAVYADSGQVEQVLMNLVVNARDAMPDGGVLTIRCGNARLPDPAVPSLVHAVAGDYVVLTVTDTGAGIEDAVKAHIFEPYFTTKKDEGTGLGLSTVHGIVRQSGGWIAVETHVGRGSAFSVYLPRYRDETRTVPDPSSHREKNRGVETLVLVEDDAAVRRFIELALKSYGYDVLSTGRPEEVIFWIEQEPDLVDLLITDVVMPSMTGEQLASRVRAIRPDLKILFVSGYSFDVFQDLPFEGVEFFAKPFTPPALAEKIRSLFAGHPGSDPNAAAGSPQEGRRPGRYESGAG